MKRNLIFTLAISSLFVLSSCSLFGGSTEDYGEFTEIENTDTAETTYKEAKELNEGIEAVDGYESVTEVVGSFVDESNETIEIDTKLTLKIGIEDTKYASDMVMENSFGTFTTYVRFDETENMYYEYMALDFSYTDPDTSTEMNVDLSMVTEDNALNTDVTMVYDAETLSEGITDFHMLATMNYSDEMTIYTSENGYYKIETTVDEGTKECIFNENGSLVEMKVTSEDVVLTTMIAYETTLDDFSIDNYAERDLEYGFTFLGSMLMFYSISLGGSADLI